MSSQIVLNKPAVDWYTATTYHTDIYSTWQSRHSEFEEWTGDLKRWENYVGLQKNLKKGTIFMGDGVQGLRPHFLMYQTGLMSDETMLETYLDGYRGKINFSRIDFQVTIMQPKGHSQWQLMNDLEKSQKRLVETNVSYSKIKPSKQLRTIYIGKGSYRAIRIYQKESVDGESTFLRFEVQYGNNGNYKLASKMASVAAGMEQATIGDTLKHEISKLNCPKLNDIFRTALRGYKPVKTKVTPDEGKDRKAWLMKQVLPAYIEFLDTAQIDDAFEVAEAFINATRADVSKFEPSEENK